MGWSHSIVNNTLEKWISKLYYCISNVHWHAVFTSRKRNYACYIILMERYWPFNINNLSKKLCMLLYILTMSGLLGSQGHKGHRNSDIVRMVALYTLYLQVISFFFHTTFLPYLKYKSRQIDTGYYVTIICCKFR